MSSETTTPDPADWLGYNRAHWDERVPIHVGGDFYDVESVVAGKETVPAFALAEVGAVQGKRLVHTQCHIGTETLGWARHGAHVTGLDFSQPALDAAATLAARIGVSDARWVAANVYDAVAALDGEQFDIVYTGLGALCWLPDVDRWARVMADLVKPGGFLYLAEFHPFGNALDRDGITVKYDYFNRKPYVWDEPGTYADFDAPTKENVSVQFDHGLGEIVSAVIRAGLHLEFLNEHEMTMFSRYDVLQERDGFLWMPEGHPRVPLMFSLRASKPA